MPNAVIVSGARTAIGSFGGSLKDVSVVELGSLVLKTALLRAGLRPKVSDEVLSLAPSKINDQGLIPLETKNAVWDENLSPVFVDEVIMGNVLTSGQGQNPARQSVIRAGLSRQTPAFTVNKVCASGLKAIALAAESIRTGQAEVVLAGGQESMSNVPMALPKARWGYRMEISGVGAISDLMVFDGLYEIFYGYHMGVTAENIARLYDISRKEQDELGVLSHKRALAAIEGGLFDAEMVPVVIAGRKGDVIVNRDERPMVTDMEKMAKLKPAFAKDGTVTAGNASGINDGAAAVLLMSEEKARDLGQTPIVRVRSFASAAIDPAYMGLGPVPAVRKALSLAGMKISDIDVIELNEAFASQAIACMRDLNIPVDRPNPLGSGISLGHPIGATGARQMVTLIHHMKRNNSATGLVSMCIGGGMGMAMVVERV